MNRKRAGTAHASQTSAPFVTQPGNILTALLPGFLIGCGFCLSFGWLWFPALRQIILPGLLAQTGQGENGLSIPVLGEFMAAGFLLPGLVLHYANKAKNCDFATACTVHGAGLLFLLLACLLRKNPLAFSAFLGLAAALSGAYWTARLLTLGKPGSSPNFARHPMCSWPVGALAWASLLAVLLSFAATWLPPFSFVATISVLAAGVALAWMLALFVPRSKAGSGKTHTGKGLDAALRKFPLPGSIPVTAFFLFGLLFFALGSLHVLAPIGAGPFVSITHLCGVALALFLPRIPSLTAVPRRTCLVVALSMAVFALLLRYGFFTGFLLNFGSGFCEAAAVALYAALLADRGKTASGTALMLFPAGILLTLIAIATNCGYLAGWELTIVPGGFGPLLPALALAFFLSRQKGLLNAPVNEEKSVATQTANFVYAAGSPQEATAARIVAFAAHHAFTQRQTDALLLLCQGSSSMDIADELGILEKSLRTYISHMLKKSGLDNRRELVQRASVFRAEDFSHSPAKLAPSKNTVTSTPDKTSSIPD